MDCFRPAFIFLVCLICSSGRTDNVIHVSSLRPQVKGTCWAYGTTHMAEARLQNRDGFNVAFDLQKSLAYWQVYDRLLNSFHRKKKSEGLLTDGGFSANFWYSLSEHGFETFQVIDHPETPDFSYPALAPPMLETKLYGNKIKQKSVLLNVEKELISSSMTEDEAKRKIVEALAVGFEIQSPLLETTPWAGNSEIKTNSSFSKMMGADLDSPGAYGPKTFVLISSSFTKEDPDLDGKWVKYDDDRFVALGQKDLKAILALARLSVDRGWPTTIETEDHVMTLVGYKSGSGTEPSSKGRKYAIIDSLGAYFPMGLSWQSEAQVVKVVTDITVFYSAISDHLPAVSNLGTMRSVHIPFKH